MISFLYSGVAKVDACGDVVWKVERRNHHSVSRASDGSFWVPGTSAEMRSKNEKYPNGFPGLHGKEVWIDKILNISERGEIIKSIDVMNIIYKNNLERYIPKTLGGSMTSHKKLPYDITHLNDVEPLSPSMEEQYPLFESGDLLASIRNMSIVFVFDPETMEVKWKSSEHFIHQHDPDFVGDGWIGVFDNNYDFNGGDMLGGSRIVFLNPSSDSMKVEFPTKYSGDFYTKQEGKWQKLQNGNILLTESRAGRVVEVTPDGKTVWEWIHDPYSETKVPVVSSGTRYGLTRQQAAAWPCTSADSISTSTKE